MEDVNEVLNKINKTRANFADRWTRMNNDFNLWALRSENQNDYEMLTKTFKGVRDTDVVITSNNLRTFADEVCSKLSIAEMQIIVRMLEHEGEDKRDDIGKLERLFHFAFEKADERLIRLLLPPFREQIVWMASIRGWVAARILVYKDGKNVIFDFLPLDPLWLVYEIGANGLSWVAYETFRTSAAIKDEWDYNLPGKDDNSVIDYWKFNKPGKVDNIVICNKESLKSESHNLKTIPILIMPVPTRPPITNSSGSEVGGYGESIFASVRGITKVRDEFASIIATHANLMAKQPTIHYRKPGVAPITDTIMHAESVLNLIEGEETLEASPMKDISPTVVQILNWLSDQIEKGTLPYQAIGTPPASGTALNLVQEARNIVFNPQLRLLNTFYADICRLVEEQLLTGKFKVDVKTEDERKYYETQVTPIDLKKPHIIKVEFTSQTPWTQMDTYQMADMAKRLGLPDEFIQENILKIPDPKALGDQLAIEMAEHSPKLAIVRAIQAMLKYGRVDEARQLMEDLYNMSMQEAQIGQPTTTGETAGALSLPEAAAPIPTGGV